MSYHAQSEQSVEMMEMIDGADSPNELLQIFTNEGLPEAARNHAASRLLALWGSGLRGQSILYCLTCVRDRAVEPYKSGARGILAAVRS
jgi:hypothetical protein